MKRAICYGLCLILFFCLSGCGKENQRTTTEDATKSTTTEENTQTEPLPQAAKNMVILGDSIAAGYGLNNPASERFSTLLTTRLTEKTGETWGESNRAVSGADSTDLVTLLSDHALPELSTADLVVICIGANNLLGPAKLLFSACAEIGTDASGKTTIAVTQNDVSLAYQTFENSVNSGMETLRADLDTIITAIRAQNSDARIVFLTVYNPYPHQDDTLNIDGVIRPFSKISQEHIDALNAIIKERAAVSGCFVSEIDTAFTQTTKTVVNADSASYVLPDPHPNAEGHKLIAATLLQTVIVAMQ